MTVGAITLTHQEQDLVSQINWMQAEGRIVYWDLNSTRNSREAYLNNKGKVVDLFGHLMSRGAIPEIRYEYFTNPRFNIGLKRSRMQVLEDNGNKGEEIIQHPHFLPLLWYFIHGARFPDHIKQRIYAASQDSLLGDENLDAACVQAYRSGIRSGFIRRGDYNVHKEFYKLALDCGRGRWNARSIRDRIMRMSRKIRTG